MHAVHKTLLEVNEEFLVSEAPASPLLDALQTKRVLTDLDLQQLRSLEPQGSRAVKRFVLHVLPCRGPLAFPALLEALQEARAQHIVDLLLEEEAVLNEAVRPFELPAKDSPTPPDPEDPNEYARKLRANAALVESAVEPGHVIPALQQSGALSALEERLLEEVRGQRALTWTVLWGVLMQRGRAAFSAFMGALLQHGYPALFHTIQETKVTGPEALTATFTRNNTASASSVDRRQRDRSLPALDPQPMRNRAVPRRSESALSGFYPGSAVQPVATSSPVPSRHPAAAKRSSIPARTPRAAATRSLNPARTHAGAARSPGATRLPDLTRTLAATRSPAPSRLPLKLTFSPTGPPAQASRPPAGPLWPGYSVGDLEYMYTPRTQQDMGAAKPRTSASLQRPVDSLYGPTWTDHLNHLRGESVSVRSNDFVGANPGRSSSSPSRTIDPDHQRPQDAAGQPVRTVDPDLQRPQGAAGQPERGGIAAEEDKPESKLTDGEADSTPRSADSDEASGVREKDKTEALPEEDEEGGYSGQEEEGVPLDDIARSLGREDSVPIDFESGPDRQPNLPDNVDSSTNK